MRGGLGPALLALVAGALIAACGSSNTSSEEFIADADAICTQFGQDAQQAFIDSFEAAGEEAATLAYLNGLLEVRTAELAELEELDAPEDDSDTYDQYLEARRSAVDLLGSALAAAETENPQGFQSEQGAAEAERLESDDIGKELGFVACSNTLPEDQGEDVAAVLEESATSEDAERVCGELATVRFQDQFGGLDKCISSQSSSPQAQGIEVLGLRGVDEVSAQVTIELTGRDDRIDTFKVNLTFDDGSWKIETIVPQD